MSFEMLVITLLAHVRVTSSAFMPVVEMGCVDTADLDAYSVPAAEMCMGSDEALAGITCCSDWPLNGIASCDAQTKDGLCFGTSATYVWFFLCDIFCLFLSNLHDIDHVVISSIFICNVIHRCVLLIYIFVLSKTGLLKLNTHAQVQGFDCVHDRSCFPTFVALQ
jgi:hypothetical protein